MRTSKSLAEPWLNIHSWRSAQAHLQNWIFPNFTFVHMFNVPQRSKSHFCKSIQTQFGWNRTVKRAYQDLNVYFGAWHGKKMTILVWLQRCVPSFVQPPRIPYWWSEGCFLVRRIIFSLFLLFIFFFLVPGTRTKHVLAPCLWNHAQWNCFLFMETIPCLFHIAAHCVICTGEWSNPGDRFDDNYDNSITETVSSSQVCSWTMPHAALHNYWDGQQTFQAVHAATLRAALGSRAGHATEVQIIERRKVKHTSNCEWFEVRCKHSECPVKNVSKQFKTHLQMSQLHKQVNIAPLWEKVLGCQKLWSLATVRKP